MSVAITLAASLDQLGELLERQRDAIVTGDADALPRLSEQLHLMLSALLAAPERARTPAERNRIAELRLRARINHHMLGRRRVEVDKSLDALGENSAVLKEATSMRTYAAAGGMAKAAVRGRSYVTA
jgi:hypothetical protein